MDSDAGSNGSVSPLLHDRDKQYGRALPADPSFVGVIPSHKRKVRDLPFAILFIAALATMAILSIVGFSNGDPEKIAALDAKLHQATATGTAQIRQDTGLLIGVLIGSLVLALVWMELLKRFTKAFIYLTLLLGVLMVLALGIYLLAYGMQKDSAALKWSSYATLAFAVVLVILIVLFRNKIRLTALIFRETCQGVQHNTAGLLLATAIIVTLYAALSIYWVAAMVYLYSIPKASLANGGVGLDGSHGADGSGSGGGAAAGSASHSGEVVVLRETSYDWAIAFMVFAAFWATSFLSAVFQCTIAGTLARWYFGRESHYMDITSPVESQSKTRKVCQRNNGTSHEPKPITKK